jgi:hypothetical protein
MRLRGEIFMKNCPKFYHPVKLLEKDTEAQVHFFNCFSHGKKKWISAMEFKRSATPWQPRHCKGDGESVGRPIKTEAAERRNPRQPQAISGEIKPSE